MTGLFCPCVLFGRNIAALNEDVSSERGACVGRPVCIEGGIALAAITAAFNGVIEPDTPALLAEGLLFAWWLCCIYTGMARPSRQRKYHLKDAPCDPCMVHWCGICQEHREMKYHLSEGTTSDSTVTNPPQVEQMNAAAADKHNKGQASSSSSHNNLQLQPL